MAQVAEDYGLRSYGLYDDPKNFHKWGVDQVVDQVEKGRWMVPLVRYGLLPGHETSGVRFGHYILLYDWDGTGFTYHDPAFRPISEGEGRWISWRQLDIAMDPVWPARQGVAFSA
jgi:hypothetical protein